MHWLEMTILTLVNICLVVDGGDKWQIFIMLAKYCCSAISSLKSTHFYPGYISLFSQQQ